MTARLISLTSDFGLKDPYVAEMKAVILGICPAATLVDITHEVDKFNVQAGAFALASAVPYFPSGTVHLAVVDPGVGSERRPIVVDTAHGFFVGPDNGLLFLAAEAFGIKQTRLIENKSLMLPMVSDTFQGRDIFAPAAAYLAKGVAIEEFGKEIKDPQMPAFSEVKVNFNSTAGVILYVDDFGNIITNIRPADVADFAKYAIQVAFSGKLPIQMKLSRTYADVETHQALALVGSHGFVEIAVNKGNAAQMFSAKSGDTIVLSKPLTF